MAIGNNMIGWFDIEVISGNSQSILRKEEEGATAVGIGQNEMILHCNRGIQRGEMATIYWQYMDGVKRVKRIETMHCWHSVVQFRTVA